MAYNWVFDKIAFIETFPEFATVSDAQSSLYVILAKSYFDASQYSALDSATANTLYQLILAHLLSLASRSGNGGIGAISQAGEGSVNLGFTSLNNMNWWQQTTYGSMFWQLVRRWLSPVNVSGCSGVFYV